MNTNANINNNTNVDISINTASNGIADTNTTCNNYSNINIDTNIDSDININTNIYCVFHLFYKEIGTGEAHALTDKFAMDSALVLLRK